VPELPEVEVVRSGLERHVVGRTIRSAEVLHPRAVRRHAAGRDDFEAATRGLVVTAALRRGKYLWLPVAQDAPGSAAEDALLAHLGMSGQLLLNEPGDPVSPHVRIRFTFTDSGPELRFTDQRTFGHILLDRGGAALPAPIAHIAPDPLEAAFDEGAVLDRLRTRQTGIKRALLDQSLMSGQGHLQPAPGQGHRAARGGARGPGRRAGRGRHLVRQPVCERQRRKRILRPVIGGIRARRRAMPAVRGAGAARSVHEQVRV